MKSLTLFLGDTDLDLLAKQVLDEWRARIPDIVIEYESVHNNPAAVVRLGITDLPALVREEEIIAQGTPEKWVLPPLDR